MTTSSLEKALGALTIAAILAGLEMAVRLGFVNMALTPSPSLVLATTVQIIVAGSLWEPLGSTLYLLFAAYFLGSILAIGSGLLMGRFDPLHDLFEPLIEFLRPLPKPALLPPLILFLGLGDPMKLTIVGMGVFFPVLVNTIQGVRGTDPVQLNVARTFGHSRSNALFRVVLPSALPMIFAGLRVSLGLGLILVVIAEMLAGTGGVGYLIIDMQRSFQVAKMYAWILILAVLGFALNYLFLQLERKMIPWTITRSS
jgi:ABC-type nitrate/sulfonate/bicarbonate transport system permease component